MQEVKVKTHLITTDMHEEYKVNWCGKLKDANPKVENGKPIFVIVSSKGRMTLNTLDIKELETWGKKMTYPRGRKAVTTDVARIFLKEVDGNEKLMCVVTHNHIKQFAPMYDKVYKKKKKI